MRATEASGIAKISDFRLRTNLCRPGFVCTSSRLTTPHTKAPIEFIRTYTPFNITGKIVGDEKFRLLKSIDELVKSDSPMDIYNKYKPLYLKFSNPRKHEQKQINKFF